MHEPPGGYHRVPADAWTQFDLDGEVAIREVVISLRDYGVLGFGVYWLVRRRRSSQ